MNNQRFELLTDCPAGHENKATIVLGENIEDMAIVLCASCGRLYNVWVKLESRPVPIINSKPQWEK